MRPHPPWIRHWITDAYRPIANQKTDVRIVKSAKKLKTNSVFISIVYVGSSFLGRFKHPVGYSARSKKCSPFQPYFKKLSWCVVDCGYQNLRSGTTRADALSSNRNIRDKRSCSRKCSRSSWCSRRWWSASRLFLGGRVVARASFLSPTSTMKRPACSWPTITHIEMPPSDLMQHFLFPFSSRFMMLVNVH